MFAQLEAMSHYSFHRGTAPPAALALKAAELGYEALALTDLNRLSGAVEFYRSAKELGIRPIIGATVDDPEFAGMSAVLLAKNRVGYFHVNSIVSKRALGVEGFNLLNELKDMLAGGEDVAVLTRSPLLLRGLAPLNSRCLHAALLYTKTKESKAECLKLIALAKELRLPLVATGGVVFCTREDYELHRTLRAIGALKTVGDLAESDLASPECWLKSPQEMRSLYRGHPEAVQNAARLAEECRFEFEFGVWHFPHFNVPAGETPASYLRKVCQAGLKKRYAGDPPRAAYDRLNMELVVIERLGFSSYFLVVWDIAREGRRRGMYSLGRGSAANSIVAYCLKITHVDPLEHNLYFERFMNPERKSPPDIDLDFPHDRRDEILEYIYERWGEGRVAMISTINRYGARGAIRETSKALGMSGEEISAFAKLIPHTRAMNLTELKERYPQVRNLPLEEEPFRTILKLGTRLDGCPHHMGIHCGGVVITPGPLAEFTALEKSGGKGLTITQYDMGPIEDLGLIKIDILGNRSLGAYPLVMELVEKHTGQRPPIDEPKHTFDDDRTRRLVASGRTMGCFYIESPAMRQLNQKLGCDSFELLTASSSVIRPGVAESGMMQEFIARHKDPSRISYLHPRMEELLGETYGVMVYQEDVIKVAHHIGGLTLGEGDTLRRAMSGKMRSKDAMAASRNKFFTSCLISGMEVEVTQEIWRQISSFAGYAFCKAHSASFAVLSFQMAYLKAHHPAEFMAGMISSGGGFYSAGAYVQEARRIGLNVLGPCVNSSEPYYSGKGKELRIGLRAVKNLHEETIQRIVEERRSRGPYRDLRDFLTRTDCGHEQAKTLIRVGAFKFTGCSRPELLWLIEAIRKHKERTGGSLMADRPLELKLPKMRDYTLPEKCRAEAEILGYTVSTHMLTFYEKTRRKYGCVQARELPRLTGETVRLLGAQITYKRLRTKKGEPMQFMSFEDLSDTFEVTLFPRVYTEYAPITCYYGPYLVEGLVETEAGVPSVTCAKLALLSETGSPWRQQIEEAQHPNAEKTGAWIAQAQGA